MTAQWDATFSHQLWGLHIGQTLPENHAMAPSIKGNKLQIREMAQSECLSYKHEGLSSIPRAHTLKHKQKQPGGVMHTCKPSAENIETGRSWGILASQLGLLDELQVRSMKDLGSNTQSEHGT